MPERGFIYGAKTIISLWELLRFTNLGRLPNLQRDMGRQKNGLITHTELTNSIVNYEFSLHRFPEFPGLPTFPMIATAALQQHRGLIVPYY